MLVRRAAPFAPALLLAAACGPATSGGAGTGKGTGVGAVITDAGAVSSGPTELPALGPWVAPPAPGTDGFDALWPLGAEPSVPPVFGKLRPWMTRGDAARARPAEWKTAWTVKAPGAIGAVAHAGQPDEADNPLELLSLVIDHADTLSHLHAAWGTPDARGYDGVAVCWMAPSAKLKACFARAMGDPTVDIGGYQPLADALAGPRRLATLAAHIGTSRRELIAAYPHFLENLDPEERWIDVRFPSTEYAAAAGPDRVLFYLDTREQVEEIAVRFGGNDPSLRPALIETVRAAAGAVEHDGLHATVLVDEPIDVVVVLSRRDDLR